MDNLSTERLNFNKSVLNENFDIYTYSNRLNEVASSANISKLITLIEDSDCLENYEFEFCVLAMTEFFYNIFAKQITTKPIQLVKMKNFNWLLDKFLSNDEINLKLLRNINYTIIKNDFNDLIDIAILKISLVSASRNDEHHALDMISRVNIKNKDTKELVINILTLIGIKNEHLLLRFIVNNWKNLSPELIGLIETNINQSIINK